MPLLIALLFLSLASAQDHRTWRDYGGAQDAAQYSSLAQVNRSNVTKLEIAWTFPWATTASTSSIDRRRRHHVRARTQQLDHSARCRHR
jgi:hypothetical protein